VVDDEEGSGKLTSVGYQYISPRWSVNLQDIRAHDNYRDLGSTDGSPVPRRTLNGNLGLSLGRGHSLTLNYSEQRDAQLLGSRIVSMGYSGAFGSRVQAFATAFRDLDLEDSNGVYVGLSITLDSRSSIHASSSRNGNDETHTLGASRAVDSDLGGFGWDVYAERGNNEYRRGSARLDYEGRFGELSLQHDRTSSSGSEFKNTSCTPAARWCSWMATCSPPGPSTTPSPLYWWRTARACRCCARTGRPA
jgi:outer membrane usher protein